MKTPPSQVLRIARAHNKWKAWRDCEPDAVFIGARPFDALGKLVSYLNRDRPDAIQCTTFDGVRIFPHAKPDTRQAADLDALDRAAAEEMSGPPAADGTTRRVGPVIR